MERCFTHIKQHLDLLSNLPSINGDRAQSDLADRPQTRSWTVPEPLDVEEDRLNLGIERVTREVPALHGDGGL